MPLKKFADAMYVMFVVVYRGLEPWYYVILSPALNSGASIRGVI